MAKIVNKFKDLVKKIKWPDALNSGIRREENVVRNRILSELRDILSNLDTDIPVDYERIEENGSVHFRVGPVEGTTFTRETDGASIATSSLFEWLNEGTDEKNIRIIGDYERETFPNSLRTVSQDNSGVIIIASKKYKYPGIEARNWIPLLRDKYQSEIERSFLTGIKQYLSGK